MKNLFILLGAFTLIFCLFAPAPTAAAPDPYTITFDEYDESYFDSQIDEEYADLGIHFTPTPPTDPAISFYSSTVYTSDTWPTTPFSFEPIPPGQFLALHKPQGEVAVTGVGMMFDYFCTEIAFDYRRPGSNAVSYTVFYVQLFDTTQNGEPFYSVSLEAIVKPPPEADANGYLSFSLAAPEPFDMVVLSASKKFQIDNLSITPGDTATGDEGGEITPSGPLSPIEGDGVGGAGCFISSLGCCTSAKNRMEALQLACILILSLKVGGHVAMQWAKCALEVMK